MIVFILAAFVIASVASAVMTAQKPKRMGFGVPFVGIPGFAILWGVGWVAGLYYNWWSDFDRLPGSVTK